MGVRDQGYPLKSTLFYLAVAAVIDGLAFALAAKHCPPGAPTLVWTGWGVLIGIRVGPLAVVLSAVAGAAVGIPVALAAKLLIRHYQRAAAESLVAGSPVVEWMLAVGWLAGAATAYYLADATLFPGLSGMIAAANVLLSRALVYPELVDLYWLASRIPEPAAAQEVLDTVAQVK
jgi:hypothetical protein